MCIVSTVSSVRAVSNVSVCGVDKINKKKINKKILKKT